MTTIDKILGELKLYEDRVFINPLLEDEIEQIQSKFKKRIPSYFIEFLKKIGLKQDLVFGINEGLNRFEDISDFIESEDYFRFGDNGGEDYWLLKFDNENDRTIYEYDYFCDFEIKSSGKTFDQLLLDSLEKVKVNYNILNSNTVKNWCVQFSIKTESGQSLEEVLRKSLEVKLMKDLEYVETSPAGVICYEGLIEIEGRKLILTKQTYKDWSSPSLSFDWQETIAEMKLDSTIKKIDKALSNSELKHVLVDYGILNSVL